jgi:hypothetical protein
MPKPSIALAALASAAGVSAALLGGCPSLSALECQGGACVDAAPGGEPDGPARGIGCGGGTTCTAPAEECCAREQGTPACVTALQCGGGSDIFCDDPSQCGGAPCWLCNAGGFQGTSCNYEGDIVQAYHCTNPGDVYRLCHSTSQCDAGSTCAPLAIWPPGADAGLSWFYGCKP